MIFKKRRKIKQREISFDEILLESSNLPSFNINRMEGRIEKPIGRRNIYTVAAIFAVIILIFIGRLGVLQIARGESFEAQSAQNSLQNTLIVAERGVIYDRNGEMLAWNDLDQQGQYDFPVRAYSDRRGLGQFIGYVSYPQKDNSGVYYRTEYLGRTGIEESYNDQLEGTNGKQLVERTARGEVISENTVDTPVSGQKFTTSLDAELSESMYDTMATTTARLGFRSGAVAMMDVETGQIIAMTSFPSYDPEVLADGDDVEKIQSYNNDERFPYLNKVVGGLYTPGSIVKPFVAYGALAEHVIDPMKIIVSNGSISVPNPYDPSHPSIFRDWRAQGPMTMRDAIAYSSDVYFYTIGGGYGDQKGLGIRKIDEYMKMFGVGQKTGIPLPGETTGNVPTPEWKKETFDDDWRLGDTYHTAIGQYGFLVTPLEMLRAYAALANGGTLLTPHVLLGQKPEGTDLHLDPDYLQVVRDGMRGTVIQNGGTARALERSDVAIAAKSGTAELDQTDSYLNSWVVGYFPYEHPKYAFILLMEHGPYANTTGAGTVMSWIFDWIAEHRPWYLKGQTSADTGTFDQGQ